MGNEKGKILGFSWFLLGYFDFWEVYFDVLGGWGGDADVYYRADDFYFFFPIRTLRL